MNGFFLDSVVDMAPYFRALPFLLTLFIPAITMRSWAEERASGTFELVMTLPLRPIAIVLGKYFAALLFYLAVLLGSLPIVIMLFCLGKPDLGLLAASYSGAVILGALLLAIGIFVSGLTREQIVAFVAGVFVCAILVLSGHEKVVEVLDGLAPEVAGGDVAVRDGLDPPPLRVVLPWRRVARGHVLLRDHERVLPGHERDHAQADEVLVPMDATRREGRPRPAVRRPAILASLAVVLLFLVAVLGCPRGRETHAHTAAPETGDRALPRRPARPADAHVLRDGQGRAPLRDEGRGQMP